MNAETIAYIAGGIAVGYYAFCNLGMISKFFYDGHKGTLSRFSRKEFQESKRIFKREHPIQYAKFYTVLYPATKTAEKLCVYD